MAALILIPLLGYHLVLAAKASQAVLTLLRVSDRKTFMALHESVWGGLAYGSSFSGVILSSLASFVAPLVEED